MKLYEINAVGINAYCSDLIVGPNDEEDVYFLSVCGYQTTVKGILANLLEHYGLSIEIDGNEFYLGRLSASYKMQIKKLPSGLAHGVVFPKLALPKIDQEKLNRFIIFTKEKEDLLPMFYRHLDEKTDVPLDPSWDKWLWNVFLNQEDWLVELKTVAGEFKGYEFSFNPKQLHDIIAEAIRDKVPEVIACMQQKGENDTNGKLNLT